jgi:hypothetical protein
MENNEEHEAEITRLVQVIEAGHVQEADRKAAEIMEKLDIQALNAGINKTVNPTSLEAAQSMRYNMKERYAVGWSDPRMMATMAIAKPDYNICFNNSVSDEQGNMKQVQIGKIDFNGGTMKFEGNAEQSAIVFMDSLATTFQGRLKAEHVSAAKLLTEFVTFELGDEVELDDGYRKGFNDAIHAVRGILSKKIKEMENKP